MYATINNDPNKVKCGIISLIILKPIILYARKISKFSLSTEIRIDKQ